MSPCFSRAFGQRGAIIKTMKTTKTTAVPDDLDWEAIEREVVLRIALLRAAWKATADDPSVPHRMMARDLYLPAVAKLAEFCSLIEVEAD